MELLPQSSVAVQVRVIEYELPQPAVVTSFELRYALAQASIATGVLNTGVFGQSIVALASTL